MPMLQETLIIEAVVYRGVLRTTECPTLLRLITPEIATTDCIECGGTGFWNYGPTPDENGPCTECKGTGKIWISC